MKRIISFSLVLVCALFVLNGCKKSTASPEAGSKAFASAPAELKGMWDKAMTAAKNKDYSTAILTLRDMNSVPGITAEQSKAVQDASAAVSDQMYDAANKGDAAAAKAVQDLRTNLRR